VLQAILDDPDADAPRAVYADALIERGDRRGELIQLQLAGQVADADRLLAEHGATWFPGPPVYPVVRRGFVMRLVIGDGNFWHYEALAAREPITELRIAVLPDGARLERLRGLNLSAPITVGELHEILVGAPALRKLELGASVDDDHARLLASRASLEGIELVADQLTATGLGAIARMPRLRSLGIHQAQVDLGPILGGLRLRRLELGHCPLAALDWLLDWPGLASIEELALWTVDLRGDWARRLFASPHAGAIRQLELGMEADPDGVVDALLDSPLAERLEVLDLSYLSLEPRTQLGFLRRPSPLPRLHTLLLADLDPAVARRFVAEAPRRLARLSVSHEDPASAILVQRWPEWWRYDEV
jgi:uncharacterized protein (TIGR02996 family)